MIQEFFERPHVQRRLQRGPMATILGTYVDHLKGRGYGRVTIQQYVQAVEHFGGWLARRGRVLADVDLGLVGEFLARHLARCRCRRQRSRTVPTIRAALRQLLAVRPSAGTERPDAAPSTTSVDGVVAAFDHHLVQTCGLAATTRHGYRREVRALLVARFGVGAVDLTALGPTDVQGFVTARALHLCPASANGVSNAVRALVLGSSHFRGIRASGASSAVPRA